MQTKETVTVTWEFDEILERHDSNWGEWSVNGIDENGNQYTGSCEADCSNPSDLHSDVREVTAVPHTPAPVVSDAAEEEIILSLIRCVLCIETNNAISHQIDRLLKHYTQSGNEKMFKRLYVLLNTLNPEWKAEIVRSAAATPAPIASDGEQQ